MAFHADFFGDLCGCREKGRQNNEFLKVVCQLEGVYIRKYKIEQKKP